MPAPARTRPPPHTPGGCSASSSGEHSEDAEVAARTLLGTTQEPGSASGRQQQAPLAAAIAKHGLPPPRGEPPPHGVPEFSYVPLGEAATTPTFDVLMHQLLMEHHRVLRRLHSLEDKLPTTAMPVTSSISSRSSGGLSPTNRQETEARVGDAVARMDTHSPIVWKSRQDTDFRRHDSTKSVESLCRSREPGTRRTSLMEKKRTQAVSHQRIAELGIGVGLMERTTSPILRFVGSVPFELLSGLAITVSLSISLVEVHITAERLLLKPPTGFELVQDMVNVLFAVELVLRLAAGGLSFCTGKSWHWNLLDVLVMLAVISERVLREGVADSPVVSPVNLRSIRMLRMTRLAKILRVSKMLSLFRAFRYLLCSIFSTLKSLVWAVLLLFILLSGAASLFTQASTDLRIELTTKSAPLTEAEQRILETTEYWWGDLISSMLSLFMAISGGVSWHELLPPLQASGSAWVFMFVAFFAFTYFAVLNVVTAVFCESAVTSAQRDKEHMVRLAMQHKSDYMEKLKSVFQAGDLDDSGTISLAELRIMMENEHIQAYFHLLDLDITDATLFFQLLDSDQKGVVDLEELLVGCVNMKGPAKGMQVVQLMNESKQMRTLMRKLIKLIEETRR